MSKKSNKCACVQDFNFGNTYTHPFSYSLKKLPIILFLPCPLLHSGQNPDTLPYILREIDYIYYPETSDTICNFLFPIR